MKTIGLTLGALALVILTKAGGAAGDKKAATPRDAIAAQLDLLKAGKTEELKAWFTDRLKLKITDADVEKGKKTAAAFTIDDLVVDVMKSTFMGKEMAKIKMKGGKTLTTLILTDGKWLADTIWFR